VVSRYHHEITDSLKAGAIEAFRTAGGREENLHIVAAPGSWELVSICAAAASAGEFDAVVALGCIIKGETSHDQHIAAAVANGLMQAGVAHGVPIAFGVLTCENVQQARARAGGSAGNKGVEAMSAAIEAAQTIRCLRHQEALG
jgi:6,7-dimethyl-8-ribityllumazine synthase